ncbi:ankyrin repeat-containing domain protein [Aspergillus cavernicola]|uniref:Ankyrin repeat-containing domain protein n=1 Tax=Aspergillus cavernicola TaxID=176166 RepID=A0ABR4HLS9_9EURO
MCYVVASTPLLTAVKDQQTALVKILLKASADVDHLPRGCSRTALQKVVESGNLELVDLLLEAGANVNANPASDGGATALQLAAIQGYLVIARRLIELGANINAAKAKFNGRTALEGAAENGRIDMLHLLLSEGARIEGDDRKQYTRAVRLAEMNGHQAAAKLLRSHGNWTELDSLGYEREDRDDFSETEEMDECHWAEQSDDEEDVILEGNHEDGWFSSSSESNSDR